MVHLIHQGFRFAPMDLMARCTLTARSTFVCAERKRRAPRLRLPAGKGESWFDGDPRGDVLILFFGEARSMSCPSTKPGARSSSNPFIARHVFLRATNLADALILSQRGKKRAPPNI